MNPQQLSLLVLAAVALVTAQSRLPSQDATRTYCGRTLSRALALLCYDDIPGKRSDPVNVYSSILSPYREQEMDWPWLVPYKARALAGPRGKRQLVVSECCDKPCSINELLTYC